MITMLVVVYIVVALLAIWPLKQYSLKIVLDEANPDTFDHGMSGIIGFITAILWPVWIGIVLAVMISKYIWMKFLDENEEEKIPQS